MHGIGTTVGKDLAGTEAAVRAALAAEGFGVLTEVDVAAVLRDKLGLERRGLKILGACNPSFAHRALDADPSVALLLPCNVVLEEEAPGTTRVLIADPRELLPTPAFADLAEEAAARLEAARDRLGT